MKATVIADHCDRNLVTDNLLDWLVQIDSTIVRAHQYAAATGREGGSHRPDEPYDHALGRSRGGLTTKIHLACDGKGRPLAILLTPGQRHDSICATPTPGTHPRPT
ncbi:transposase [Streptomyces sp. NPDC088788]|uniref:transposase n=1 Tax=Streptomyces sp. NPDC088788 TaxID=3365898 RepID=UPI0038196322